MVTELWKANPPSLTGNLMHNFVQYMKELNALSKIWTKRKREVEEQLIKTIEEEIHSFEEDMGGCTISQEQKEKHIAILQ